MFINEVLVKSKQNKTNCATNTRAIVCASRSCELVIFSLHFFFYVWRMCGFRIYCIFVWLHMPSLLSKYRLNHGQNKSTEKKTDLILCIKRYTCLRSFNWLPYNRDAFSYSNRNQTIHTHMHILSFRSQHLFECHYLVAIHEWSNENAWKPLWITCSVLFTFSYSLNGNEQEKLLKNLNQLILVWKRREYHGKKNRREWERHLECEPECRVRNKEEWEANSDILLFSGNQRFFFRRSVQ